VRVVGRAACRGVFFKEQGDNEVRFALGVRFAFR
jgi:hypothetical protein